MRPSLLAALVFLTAGALPAAAQRAPGERAPSAYAEDFEVLWRFVADEYAYFERTQTDWSRVRSLYAGEAASAADDRAFLNVLERVLGELYDPHVGLNTNNGASPRLVPTDTDLWAEWREGRAVVTDVRRGSNAEAAGLRPGMTIREIDDRPVAEGVESLLPRALRAPDPAAHDWALRQALASTHAGPVRLVAETDGQLRPFVFVPGVRRPTTPLTLDTLGDAIGYIRVHNSLGESGLVAAFDSALAALRGTRGLVLDLRDTPSGGTSTVARGIMSRLVAAENPYQRHELASEERATGVRRVWVEYVEPRGPFTYAQPVVVLVGRWTGSMGEGLAIGLDGMKRATVVGTAMAGLLGAISGRRLPNTGFVVRVPTERLMHVDGAPRESFVPPVRAPPETSGMDAALDQGVALLSRSKPDPTRPR